LGSNRSPKPGVGRCHSGGDRNWTIPHYNSCACCVCWRKTRDGSSHIDRDDQFLHISSLIKHFQSQNEPVISVDTKKKELIGDFKNPGTEWCQKEQPVEVKLHDFADPQLGKAIPYGIYDLTLNKGWVNVGIDHDTAEFAVESIRHWWYSMGKELYPNSQQIIITADCGGSNSYRNY
jgi:hypothetical protein